VGRTAGWDTLIETTIHGGEQNVADSSPTTPTPARARVQVSTGGGTEPGALFFVPSATFLGSR